MKSVSILIISAVTLLAAAHAAYSETFSWTDENGSMHFTDDSSKIPKKPSGNVSVRTDKYGGSKDAVSLKEYKRKQELAKIEAEEMEERKQAEESAIQKKKQAARELSNKQDRVIAEANAIVRKNSSTSSGNLDAQVREAEQFHSDMVDWANKMNTRKPNDPYPKIGK